MQLGTCVRSGPATSARCGPTRARRAAGRSRGPSGRGPGADASDRRCPAVSCVDGIGGRTPWVDFRSVDVRSRNNVNMFGNPSGQPMMFAHGFGCDQHMWRHVMPRFVDRHHIVLFDHVGAGNSDLAAYDSAKYSSLHGYATDMIEIASALDLDDVILVGHSVSSMIGA